MNDVCRVVAVGGSAGGRTAIKKFMEKLPGEINAAFLVVVHTAFDTPSFFAEVLSKSTDLKVENAVHGTKIKRGHVYIAQPNRHLFVNQGALFCPKVRVRTCSARPSMCCSGPPRSISDIALLAF